MGIHAEESLPKTKRRGHKRLYCKIDFRRNQKGISGRIVITKYDMHYGAGEKRYILHLREIIVPGTKVDVSMENALPFECDLNY